MDYVVLHSDEIEVANASLGSVGVAPAIAIEQSVSNAVSHGVVFVAGSGGPGYGNGGGNPGGGSSAGGGWSGWQSVGGTSAAAPAGPPPTPFNGSNYNVGTNAFSQSFGAGGNLWGAPTIADGTVDGTSAGQLTMTASRSGWEIYNQQTLGYSYASPYGGPRLSEQTIGILQPHVNMFASDKVMPPLDLRNIQVLIGVPASSDSDGRASALSYPGGINMTSPGSYEHDIGTLAHEIIHKVQERTYSSFQAFIQERTDQVERLGEEGEDLTYHTPGHIENQAEQFKLDILQWLGY